MAGDDETRDVWYALNGQFVAAYSNIELLLERYNDAMGRRGWEQIMVLGAQVSVSGLSKLYSRNIQRTFWLMAMISCLLGWNL